MFTQNKLGDTDSTGDAEESELESATVIFAGAQLVLLAMLFGHLQSKYGLTELKPLCLICSGVAISSDTKYHTLTVLQVLVK